MLIGLNAFRRGWQRWRGRLDSVTRWSDVDPKSARIDREYGLWACAMAPELVSLAALMALAEHDPRETNRGRS